MDVMVVFYLTQNQPAQQCAPIFERIKTMNTAQTHPEPDLAELVQTDEAVERNRFLRTLVTFGSPLLAVMLGYLLSAWLWQWLDFSGTFSFLGKSLGIGLGLVVAYEVANRSIIRNDATIAFMTINPLASLLGTDPLVIYGPGLHFCYFWEQRSKDNVVNLVESAVSFQNIEVQCSDGKVKMKGSSRFRPDIKRLPQFVSGAAAVSSNIIGLIVSESASIVSSKKVRDAAGAVKEVSEKLETEFKHGKGQASKVSDFEKRFGVIVGDTTMEEILPTEEIQETMGVLAEMDIISRAVAIMFGKETMAQVEEMIQEGKVTREAVNRARTQVMAASGNLQGMDLQDHNFNLNISGLGELNPDAAQAIASAFAGFTHMMAGRGNTGKGGRSPKQQQPQGAKK